MNQALKTMLSPTDEPQLFTLIRHSDETGISGIGRILDGVIFHTGQVIVCWRTDLSIEQKGFSSLAIYASWEAFKHIHIDAHPPAQTEIKFGATTGFADLTR